MLLYDDLFGHYSKIDELSQHRTHEINKNSDFKKAVEKLKKQMKEVKNDEA